jgi:hypothetical protein
MGFEKTIDVPDGDCLGFAILVRDGAEVMLQTIASARKDAPVFVPEGPASRASLFIEVEDFADVLKRLAGYPVALAERTTFYGMREIGVIEPGGHNAMFAARM